MKKFYAIATALVIACSLVTYQAKPDAYVLKGPKWPAAPHYKINPANQDMTTADFIAIVNRARDIWPNQSGETMVPIYDGTTTLATYGYDTFNTVMAPNRANPNDASIGISTYYWSTGGTTMLQFDIVVWDGAFKFITDTATCNSEIYLLDTMTHEWGHFLGLGHSTITTATMYGSYPRCSTNFRTLDVDDINGALKLYPPAPPTDPPPPPTTDGGGNGGSGGKGKGHKGKVTIISTVEITDAQGNKYHESTVTIDTKNGNKTFKMMGGTVAGITMETSDYPLPEVDDDVEVEIQNNRAKHYTILKKHD